MRRFQTLIVDAYGTYRDVRSGSAERHWPRIVGFLIISSLIAFLADSLIDGAVPIMATGITVLTGFTFTALFSDHSLASYGLPEPKTEEDRDDLKRLKELSKNFKLRSEYFLTLSVLEVVFLVVLSLELVLPDLVHDYAFCLNEKIADFLPILSGLPALISHSISVASGGFVLFIFGECLYTFYRLSETILAIVDTRRQYFEAASKSGV